MNARSITYGGFVNAMTVALLGEPVVVSVPEPTGYDLIRFVRSHPANPYPTIGWGFSLLMLRDGDTVSAIKTYLLRSLPRLKAAVVNKHWSGDQNKVRVACLILDLIDEFEATDPRAALASHQMKEEAGNG